MPCDTIQTSGIDLGKVDPGLLMAALRSMGETVERTGNLITWGYRNSYDVSTGTATIATSSMRRDQAVEDTTAEIKRAYSAEVIKSQAKRFGWQLKQTAPYKYQVVKNTY